MRTRRTMPLLAALLIGGLAVQPGLANRRQEPTAPQFPKQGLMVVQYPAKGGCLPLVVTRLLMGGPNHDVVTSAATIKNLSNGTISRVKLGWYAVALGDATRILKEQCGALAPGVEPVLSGETGLIDVGSLAEGESCSIVMPYAASQVAGKGRTVSVDVPIIAMKDISVLTTDGTLQTVKGAYGILVAVSAIDYADGTKWKVSGLPWQRS
jgi:hypothetical protein